MESMSADKTGLSTRFASLTPNLDSLMRLSHTFSNAWSAGIHTYNGIYSTLFSHPAQMQRHILKQAVIPQMCGLPHALYEAGYTTTYFMTHDPNFDNMQGFLFGNAFSTIVSEPDYPESEVVGTWGIPDHNLFDHVADYFDKQPTDKPFFVTVMTCSDHGPFIMPKNIDFTPTTTELTKQIVEYADWSIGRFMQRAAQSEWFDRTLFVFVADHGGVMPTDYDMVLSYNHIPILLYYPNHIAPSLDSRPAMQVDVAPTVCGLLGIPMADNICGLDLMQRDRHYAFFSADNKVGVTDGHLLYTYRADDGVEGIYRYDQGETTNLIATLSDTAAAMRRYAFGLTQKSQSLMLNGQTSCH